MESKTNVMRILDKLKVPYAHYCYEGSGAVSGTEVAAVLGQNPAQVFKTLVTVAKSKQHYVFMLPAGKELDLKKAAASVHEKSVEMIKSKELLPTTGYIHGGCSPIGMKKFFKKAFPTVIDISASAFETIIFSAGKIGYQVEVSLVGLAKAVKFTLADITEPADFQSSAG